jgi:anti-anti-sigma regulatory factor
MRTTPRRERSTAHACAVPVSEEQLWELTAQFVAAGLVAGEQVVYFDDGTVDAVLERLVDDRVPVRRPLADGQLTVVDTETTRQSLRGAVGDAARMLATHIDGAVHAGYAGLRMTGQFDSALLRGDGVGLPEYDAALDAVLDGRPARLLCLYDRRRFSDDAIEALRALHRVELDTPALYDDNLLRITPVAPFRSRLAGEVDHSNRPVVQRHVAATLNEALRSDQAAAIIELDLASLRFLDVPGAVALVHAAEEFPDSHRLVLTGVRRSVLRVLDRCGASFAAQLDIVPHPGPIDGPGPVRRTPRRHRAGGDDPVRLSP